MDAEGCKSCCLNSSNDLTVAFQTLIFWSVFNCACHMAINIITKIIEQYYWGCVHNSQLTEYCEIVNTVWYENFTWNLILWL